MCIFSIVSFAAQPIGLWAWAGPFK